MTPLAISFVHTALLGGLALASLPVIIHILNRRRFKTLEWAAMEFLLKAAVRNRRRIRFESLLLLLLRVAVVVALVLALARPFSERQGFLAALAGEGSAERIVLLDDSHSMRAGVGNRSSFDVARDMVKAMAARLHDDRSGDRVTIVLGSDPRGSDDRFARVAVAGAHYARMIERLDALRPSDGRLDLPGSVEAILRAFDEKAGRLILHVVSDFRAADWTGPDGALDPRAIAALRRFSERGETHLVDVGAPPAGNVSVTDLALRERAVIAGVPVHAVATVVNRGPDPVSGISVSFRAGDRALPGKRIEGTLAPGVPVPVVQEFTFPADGEVAISAEIPTDVLPGDDARRLVVAVRRALRFLLVDGETSPDAFRGETDYLAAALAPGGAMRSGIEVDVVPERAFTGKELASVDGVFLCNVDRLPPERVRMLEDFVRGGGGLVFFVGDQVEPAEWNACFLGSGDEAGKRLLPLPLGEAEGSTDDYVHWAAPSADHPVVRFLRGMNEIVMRTVVVQRYLRCEPIPGGEARAILTYDDVDASPALVEKPFGEGRVLLFTTAADTEWSSLPLSPLYLAVLQEVAAYVAKPDTSESTRDAGAPIEVVFDPARMKRRAMLVPPDSAGEAPIELPLLEDAETKRLVFAYDPPNVAGLYVVRAETPEGEPLALHHARNVHPREGDLARLDRPQRLAREVPGASVRSAGDEALLGGGDDARSEFWRPILYALLAFAILETWLAWRFGHHAARRLGPEGKQVFVR